VKLLKALYGCVQSSLLWYRHLKSSLESIGLEANAKDDCVFNLNRDGYQCTACVHVDDVFLTCANNYVLDCVILDINNSYNETTVHRGDSSPYLGMLFDFSEPGVAMVSMVLQHRQLHRIFTPILCTAIYLLHYAYPSMPLYVSLDCSADGVSPPSGAIRN